MWSHKDYVWSPYQMVAHELKDVSPPGLHMPSPSGQLPNAAASHIASREDSFMSASNSIGAGTREATHLLESQDFHRALTTPATQPQSSSDPQSSMETGSMSSKIATPVCQVKSCGADLTGCKEYHQRYKICAHHFKVCALM